MFTWHSYIPSSALLVFSIARFQSSAERRGRPTWTTPILESELKASEPTDNTFTSFALNQETSSKNNWKWFGKVFLAGVLYFVILFINHRYSHWFCLPNGLSNTLCCYSLEYRLSIILYFNVPCNRSGFSLCREGRQSPPLWQWCSCWSS